VWNAIIHKDNEDSRQYIIQALSCAAAHLSAKKQIVQESATWYKALQIVET
jgi:hypothetical protein